jgi:hypothetical protein
LTPQSDLTTALITTAIEEVPNVIELIKAAFVKKNPTAPVPTSEEVIAAGIEGLRSSLAKDDAWDAAHPA